MSPPTSVDDVISRLRGIDAELPHEDGAAVFNRMYLTVTERIAAVLAEPKPAGTTFEAPVTMAALDVRFAAFWLAAYEAAEAHGTVPSAWRPLFEARGAGRLPVQYAIAGMNTHIEHDLPLAVVDICEASHLEPDQIRSDYDAVNLLLADVESGIRRSFLDSAGRQVDDRLGPVVHLVNTWNIDKARDLAWVTVETLWELRSTGLLRARFIDSLAHTVGMTSRALLAPT